MYHHCSHSSAILGTALFLAATLAVASPASAQDSSGTAGRADAGTARIANATYTPQASRADNNRKGNAAAEVPQRKPRWFDERRVKDDKSVATGHFERLSYTRYEGEADAGSGSCVYYQSSYTYSCR